jgi:hypothetical protein
MTGVETGASRAIMTEATETVVPESACRRRQTPLGPEGHARDTEAKATGLERGPRRGLISREAPRRR